MSTITNAPSEDEEALAFCWLVENGYDSIEEWARDSDLVYHHDAEEWFVMNFPNGTHQDPWSVVPDLLAYLLEVLL